MKGQMTHTESVSVIAAQAERIAELEAANLALIAERDQLAAISCTEEELIQQEPVAIAECKEVYGNQCQFLNRTRHGIDTLKDGDKLYTKPIPPAIPEGKVLMLDKLTPQLIKVLAEETEYRVDRKLWPIAYSALIAASQDHKGK